MRFSRLIVLSFMIACCCGARGEDFFPITPWELPPRTREFADDQHGLASLVECGFNVAAFVRPEHLPQCEKLKLKAIVCPADGILNWAKMRDDEIERTIVEMIDASRTNPAVIGYLITHHPA